MLELAGVVARWAILRRVRRQLLDERVEVHWGGHRRRWAGEVFGDFLDAWQEHLIACDLGSEGLDLVFACFALFVDVALFPAGDLVEIESAIWVISSVE